MFFFSHKPFYVINCCSSVCDTALIWGPDGVGGDYVYGSSYTGDEYAYKAKLGKQDGNWRIGESLTDTGDYIQV